MYSEPSSPQNVVVNLRSNSVTSIKNHRDKATMTEATKSKNTSDQSKGETVWRQKQQAVDPLQTTWMETFEDFLAIMNPVQYFIFND